MGGSINGGTLKLVVYNEKTRKNLLKRMIWGYPYFRKPPYEPYHQCLETRKQLIRSQNKTVHQDRPFSGGGPVIDPPMLNPSSDIASTILTLPSPKYNLRCCKPG